jgi:chromosome condensin MukBEF ATPase and DNA-binding subunit MukB
MRNNETQTEDDAAEHLNKVSESIQKLENAIPKNFVHKRVESLTTPNKVTTKVTLNVQKFTGRSSDVSHIKQVQEQARHSICNNAEIIKRLQMHFQAKDHEAICNSKNDLISSSCSSLVPKENGCNGEIKKHQKYFCRNCGFTMIPAEILQRREFYFKINK